MCFCWISNIDSFLKREETIDLLRNWCGTGEHRHIVHLLEHHHHHREIRRRSIFVSNFMRFTYGFLICLQLIIITYENTSWKCSISYGNVQTHNKTQQNQTKMKKKRWNLCLKIVSTSPCDILDRECSQKFNSSSKRAIIIYFICVCVCAFINCKYFSVCLVCSSFIVLTSRRDQYMWRNFHLIFAHSFQHLCARLSDCRLWMHTKRQKKRRKFTDEKLENLLNEWIQKK